MPDPLEVDIKTKRSFIITFANKEVREMVCYNGHKPEDEVAKWKDPNLTKKNIISCREITRFPKK